MDRVSWPVHFETFDAKPFEAELKIVSIGPLSLRSNMIGPIIAERRPEHVARVDEERFILAYHTQGRLLLSHHGREEVYGPGDFALSEITAPARLHFLEPTRTLALMIPGQLLRHRVACPQSLCGLRLSGTRGFARVLRELILTLWEEIEEGQPVSPEYEARAVHHVLDLLASAYATTHPVEVESSSIAGARLATIKQHIERHLRDPNLTPASIAEACGISQRYLRKLFEAESDGVTRFIQRRRLEAAARELTSNALPIRSVTEIALGLGFNSVSHFSRAFREQFGMTPREYRRSSHSIADLARGVSPGRSVV